MGTAVELAVDLAVGAVIARRSGCEPRWLILDECFEGLGANEKEAALNVLQQYSQNKLIVVIDHGSEAKEMFNNNLTIECQHGRSTCQSQKSNDAG
jgi:ABC-type molybdenum transport system ATPase subunit/photorepair protein PhrA